MKHIVGLTLLLLSISCTEGPLINTQESGGTEAIDDSYSQIIIVGDFLYDLNDEVLSTVDIRDNENPIVLDVQELDFDPESIYHHDEILYIGSATRMHIFPIDENGIPRRQSTTEYGLVQDDIICSSDRVVRDGRYAYVAITNRNQNEECRRDGVISELRIYDVQDLQNPELISITDMRRPLGLGISEDLLFVSDYLDGLYVFDIADVRTPELVGIFYSLFAQDVIVKPSQVIVVSKDALYQYDYSDRENITLLSRIDL